MYISMDEFKKMDKFKAGAARVIDINKNSDGTVEKDPQLKFKLLGHTVLTLCIAIFSGVRYLEKPDDKTVVTEDTLFATLSIIAIANFLLSALNTAAEWMKSEGVQWNEIIEQHFILSKRRSTMGSELCFRRFKCLISTKSSIMES